MVLGSVGQYTDKVYLEIPYFVSVYVYFSRLMVLGYWSTILFYVQAKTQKIVIYLCYVYIFMVNLFVPCGVAVICQWLVSMPLIKLLTIIQLYA